MATTRLDIGQAQAGARGDAAVLVGSLTQVSLGSGGVKIAAVRGLCRLAGWEEEPRIVLQLGGGGGVWLLVSPRYARGLEPLAPAPEVRIPPHCAPAPEGSPVHGDRTLVLLRNHLAYSGYFLGRARNPFHGDRDGSLLGFEREAPLLYWFDDAEVHRLRVTVPGSLPGLREPLGLVRE